MTRRRALWILGVVWLVLGAYMLSLESTMQDGGYGIVDYELAFTSDEATTILTAWGDEGRDAARLQLWLDYLYLVVYGLFLWLAIKAVRDGALRRGWTRYARPGAAIAILPLVAAGADAIEDAFLLLRARRTRRRRRAAARRRFRGRQVRRDRGRRALPAGRPDRLRRAPSRRP